MEQNREPRNEPTCIWSINPDNGGKNGEKTATSINTVGKTEQLHAKEETGLSHTIYKNNFKMD